MGKYGKYMGHGRTIKGILVLLASISLYVKLFFLVHSSLLKTAITPMCQPYFFGDTPPHLTSLTTLLTFSGVPGAKDQDALLPQGTCENSVISTLFNAISAA